MSRVIDNLIAYRILSMLVTPFDQTDAFKLGIIDKAGTKIKEPNKPEEYDSYDYLHRLVFNLKKILNKLPGGESKTKNLIAALYLIKERYKEQNENDHITEYSLTNLINLDVILAEETVQYNIFEEDVVPVSATTPMNHTGPETSTDEPVVRKKPKIIKRMALKPVSVNFNQNKL